MQLQCLIQWSSLYTNRNVILMYESESERKWSHSVVSDSLQPCGLWPTRLFCPWDFPGKNTGVGCHFLLQGIFLTQGSNPGLLHCGQTKADAGRCFNLWATREAPCIGISNAFSIQYSLITMNLDQYVQTVKEYTPVCSRLHFKKKLIFLR